MPHHDNDMQHATMSFGEHLEELRKRIILAIAGVVVACFITFPVGKTIVWWLCVPLHRSQRLAGLTPETIAQNVTSAFTIWMKVSIIAAALLAAPWIAYQTWKFIEAGLYTAEKKVVYILAPFSSTMVILGVVFMYYVILPISLFFLILISTTYPPPGGESPGLLGKFTQLTNQSDQSLVNDNDTTPSTSQPGQTNESEITLDSQKIYPAIIEIRVDDPPAPVQGQIWYNKTLNELHLFMNGKTLAFRSSSNSSMRTLIEIGSYINFVIIMTIGMVIGFQLPVFMTILGWTKLVDPDWLARYRKYCILICFILGAVLTPSDPFSMVALAVPLWALYELGLLLMRQTYRSP